jgi:hypothetical protein
MMLADTALNVHRDAQRELLEIIASDADVEECGRRALIVAFLLCPDLFNGKQAVLATRLKISESRCSQLLSAIRPKLSIVPFQQEKQAENATGWVDS